MQEKFEREFEAIPGYYFKPSKYAVLPFYLTDPKIVNFVTRDRLRDELEGAITKLESAN